MAPDGKVFAITGGARGIGLATAEILVKKGATVCVADVNPSEIKKAEEHFTSLKASASVTKVDVSRRDEVDSWIESVVQKYGRLDGAVNCAAIIGKHHGIRPVSDLDDDEWDKIMAVNLTGLMYCLRAELRKIVDGGSIVNVSSIQGVQGFANHGAYSASKHGVIGLTKAAAKENGEREVRVNAVAPGAIHTPMMEEGWKLQNVQPRYRRQDVPAEDDAAFGRQGTAEEVANVIVFLLSPESRYVSGSVYGVDGAWNS